MSLIPTPAPASTSRSGGRHRKQARFGRTHRLVVALAAVGALLLSCASATATESGRPRAPDPTAESIEPRFAWPLAPAPPPVLRTFDAPEDPYGPGHRGVDLGAEPGQEVLAAAEGFVVFAGQLAGRGVLSIDHDGGLRSTYEPVDPGVAAGGQVSAGQPIGTVTAGHPDCPAAACLHWGIRRTKEYLDPLPLVNTDTSIRLKPWTG